MVQAILDVFRVEVGEFFEIAEYPIYARHVRDLVSYLEEFLLSGRHEESELRPILQIAEELGYQLRVRKASVDVLNQLMQRVREHLTENFLYINISSDDQRATLRRVSAAAMVIADYTHHLELGYARCETDELVFQTQHRYHAMLDAMPNTVVVYDKEERCVFANKACYEGSHKTLDHIVGKSRAELSDRYNQVKDSEAMWTSVRGGECVKMRIEYFGEDGLEVNEKVINPIFDKEGQVAGFVVVNYPTETEKERLYHLQRQFSFVLNSMNSGLLILNREAVVAGFNKRAETMFGLEAEEVLGESLFHLYQKHVGGEMKPDLLLSTLMEEGVPIRSVEMPLTLHDRTLKLRIDGNPIKNSQGAVVGYILIIDDLTELVAMREAMMRNEKFALIGQFAAGIAHEIRNPLTTVFGFLQLYAQRAVEPANFLELTNQLLLPEIDRANTILSDFLMVSKPQAPQRTLVETSTFFSDIVRLVESEANLRGVVLNVEVPPELPSLSLDVQQMKQVFLNLCKNGFDVTPPGGCLHLHVQVEGQEVRFHVIDEGQGIQMKDLSRIFEPFFTTKEHGTGLGLPISHRIVEGHGGTLQVRSTEGVGTTFVISVPVPE